MLETLAVLGGALRYEFRMQVRRPSVWVISLALTLLLLRLTQGQWTHLGEGLSSHDAILLWTSSFQLFLPVGFGVLLADRWVRDDHLRISELLETVVSCDDIRLIGKCLGSMLATSGPLASVYVGGVGAIALRLHAAGAVAFGLAAFASVVVPGLVFIAGFSLACPTVMPVPLYQFLFIGYWFWGNLLTPHFGIPTHSQTILTPIGDYRLFGFFGLPASYGAPPQGYTLGAAIASTVLMLALPVLPLVAASAMRRRRLARA